MKILTKDLIGPALDWAARFAMPTLRDLAHYGGKLWYLDNLDGRSYAWAPSTEGSEVIDIMEREMIEVCCYDPESLGWRANKREADYGPKADPLNRRYSRFGPTLRIAVCRCFVASKLGDWVEVPEELIINQEGETK